MIRSGAACAVVVNMQKDATKAIAINARGLRHSVWNERFIAPSPFPDGQAQSSEVYELDQGIPCSILHDVFSWFSSRIRTYKHDTYLAEIQPIDTDQDSA